MKRNNIVIGIILLAIAAAGFSISGCRIIEPFCSNGSSGTIPGLIGRYTLSGGVPLDVRSGAFHLFVPAGAAPEGTAFIIAKTPEPIFPFLAANQPEKPIIELPPHLVRLSNVYDIVVSPASTTFNRPARLELPYRTDKFVSNNPDIIRVACKHDDGGIYLLSPAIDQYQHLAIVEPFEFSKWMVVRPEPPSKALPSLQILSDPQTIAPANEGSFDKDLIVILSDAFIKPTETAENEIEIIPLNGPLPAVFVPSSGKTQPLPLDYKGNATIALDSSQFISRQTAGEAATFTMRFAIAGLKPTDMASRLLLRWRIKRSDGILFLCERMLVTTQLSADETPTRPRLVEFSPHDNDSEVPLHSPIELTFDMDMDKASVLSAISVKPSNTVSSVRWLNDRQVSIIFNDLWPTTAKISVTIATSARSIDGASLESAVSWSFITAAETNSPPDLVSIVPASGTKNITTNSLIKLTFSKPMLPITVENAITLRPAVDKLSFTWSQDYRSVEFIPLGGYWQADTSYLLTIANTAEDLEGLHLIRAISAAFTTGVLDGPSVSMTDPIPDSILATIPTSLSFSFSRPMNKQLTEEAFSVSPSPVGTANFIWSESNRALTIVWPNPFPDRTSVIAAFSAAARDSNNLPLSGKVTFSFKIPDLTKPRVLSTQPAEGAYDFLLNSPIEIEFSESMNVNSVLKSLLLTPSNIDFTSVWDSEERHLTISPKNLWPASTTIIITIGAGSSDKAGNQIDKALSLSFKTTSRQGPVLSRSVPSSGTTGVLPNAPLELTFSTSMDATTLANALDIQPHPQNGFSTEWNESATQVKIIPLPSWANAATITVKLATTLLSVDKIPMPAVSKIIFVTADIEPPIVIAISPADGAERVPTNASITISFNEVIDANSLKASITLSPNPSGNMRMRSFNGQKSFEFSWSEPLADLTDYTFAINTGTRDAAGNFLKQPILVHFTTADTTKPELLSTWPENNAASIATFSSISFNFSKTMNPEAVYITISPQPDDTPQQIWTNENKTLTLVYPNGLAASTTYRVIVSENTSDIFGNQLGENVNFSFTTFTPKENAPMAIILEAEPSISAANPDKPLRVIFQQPMNESAVEEAVSLSPAPQGTPSFSWNVEKTQLSLTFSQPLSEATVYSFKIASSACTTDGVTIGIPFATQFVTTARPRMLADQMVPASGSTYIASTTYIELPFSKAMNKPSVEAAFSLKVLDNLITGTYNWEADKLIFTPGNALPAATVCTISLLKSASDINGVSLANDWTSTFTTAPNIAPTIVSAQPADGAINVPIYSPIVFNFSAPMATSSVSLAITPTPYGRETRQWSSDKKSLQITFSGGFANSTLYNVTIAPGACDILGVPLSGATSISFTAEAAVVPRVIAISPEIASSEVPRTSEFVIVFDKSMKKDSVISSLSFSPIPNGTASYTWSDEDKKLTVRWSEEFTLGTTYVFKIAASAESAEGTALGTAFTGFFTIEAAPFVIPESRFPAPEAIQIATNTVIRLTFSKSMSSSSVASAFSLKAGDNVIPGAFSWSGNSLTFTPTALPASAACSVVISTAAHDERGNHLIAPVSWNFYTVAQIGTKWSELLPNDFGADDRFGVRYGHATIFFNNRLWVIGGTDGYTFFNDVWSSADGITWRQDLAHTETPGSTRFRGRTSHACAVFNGRIWLTGGYIDTGSGLDVTDDVWSSADGTTWRLESASAEYWARAEHQMLVFDGKLWILGGQTYDDDDREMLLGDTWVSSNGINWSERGQTSAFFPRRLPAAAVIGNAMFIFGGYGADASGAIGPRHDIWKTTNGDLWTLITTSAPFSPRSGAAVTTLNGITWLIGGYGVAAGGFDESLNDVWNTKDGVNWNSILSHNPNATGRFSPRQQLGLAQLGQKLFIIGGESYVEPLNDVWRQD